MKRRLSCETVWATEINQVGFGIAWCWQPRGLLVLLGPVSFVLRIR